MDNRSRHDRRTPDESSDTDAPRRGRGLPMAQLPGSDQRARCALYESILGSLGDGVAVADPDGKFLFFNDAAERILGIGAAAIAPEQWSSSYGLFLPDRVTAYPAEELPLARAIRGETVAEIEIFVRNPARKAGRWISVNASPLLDDQGGLAGGVAVFRDVTARRRAREVVTRLSRAVERTADSVFITDEQGRIEYVNPAFESTTGFTREEAMGKTPAILKSGRHDREYYRRLWSTIVAGEVHTGTVVNRKKNGELYDAEQTITPVRDSSGNLTHFVSVVKDVTTIRRAEALEVELRLARTIQKRLYPSRPVRMPGLDLAGEAYAADETCGDYFDFFPMAGGSVAVAIGDVSGHGFGPALLMAETRAYLRSLAATTPDVGEILLQLNSFLERDTADELFVTLTLLCLDPTRRRLVYSSAGHPPGYLIGASGEIKRELTTHGLPLGLFVDRFLPRSEEAELEPGDLILLLTDGLLEAEDANEEFFGPERVLEIVRQRRDRGAREIVEALHAGARKFTGGRTQIDDITIVACKVTESR